MTGIVWDDAEIDVLKISELPRGEVTEVTQPKYITVKIRDKKTKTDRIIPIGRKNELLKLRGDKEVINYRENSCDLLFAVTFHKLPGLTMDKIILSIGKHPIPQLRVRMPSLYVGTSRVHEFNELRVLPLSKDDISFLTQLERDPLL